jgi:drug/metabolite transporter (DMT)-like permease
MPRPSTDSGRTERVDRVATMAILGALVCWSSTPIWIKYFAGYFDPFSQNLYRYAFAVMIWLPFLAVRQWTGQVPRRIWGLAVWPTLANAAMQTFWAWSLYYLDAGFMSLMSRTTVIWSALLSIALLADERRLARSGRFWFGLGLGLVGAVGVLIFKPGFTLGASTGGSTRTLLIGVSMAVGAALLWSVYAVAVRVTMRGTDSRVAFAVIALETTVVCAVIALVAGRPGQVVHVPLGVNAMVALSGWICIAAAHVFYYAAIQRIGVAIPTALLQLTPFIVMVLSYAIYGEVFTAGQLGSGAILVLGSVMALWAQDTLREGQAERLGAPSGD